MFCKNCGNSIEDGVKFCIKCGARVETEPVPAEKVSEEAAPAETVSEQVAPAESIPEQTAAAEIIPEQTDGVAPVFPEEPPKKRGKKIKKIAIISSIAVASLVGISALASAIFPEVSNFFAKVFLPGEKYLAYALKNTAEPLAEDVTSLRTMLDGGLNIPTGGEVSAEYVLGDGFYDLVGKQDPQVAAAISWVKSIGVQADVKSGGNVYGADVAYTVNGKNFVSGGLVMDMNRGDVYVSAPDFLEKPVRASTGVTISEADIEEVRKLYEGLVKIVPEEKVLKDMLGRYLSAAGKAVTNAEKQSAKITAGGVTESTTCVKVGLSEKLAVNVAKAILKEAKGDKDIKDILKNVESFAGQIGESFDADAVYDEMQDGIEEAMDELEDVDADSKRVATLKFWVNNRGEITGMGISADGAEIKMYITRKGNKTGLLYSIDAGGQTIAIEGSSEAVGGKVNGNYAVSFKGAELVKITVSDVDEAKLKEKGVFSGKMVIEPSDAVKSLAGVSGDAAAFLNGAKIEITSNAVSENEGNAEVAVHLGGKHFVSLKVTAKLRYDSANVSIPRDYIDTRYGEEIQPNLNQEAIIRKLEDVGAPEMLIRELEESIAPAEEIDAPAEGIEMPSNISDLRFQFR